MNSFGKAGLGLACGALAFASVATAQQVAVFAGGEMVVTAARVPQRLSDALGGVLVITARDIEESGQLTFGQLLQLYGGVELTSNGGPGSASAVFMRGANSAHTLVLVDGMRVESATTGTSAIENIPLAQIERIEIVPGPMSGLYGSDAIGGVIQVFTKGGHASPGARAGIALGSYDTRSASASLSGGGRDTEFSVSGARFETRGFSATKPTVPFGQFNPDDDGYGNSNVSAKLDHTWRAGQEVGAALLYSRGKTRFDDGPGSDPRTEQTLATYSLHSRNQLTGAWQSLVRIGSSRDDSSTIGTAFPGEFRTDQDQALWQNTFRFGANSLVAGYEYVGQRVATDERFAVTHRTISSVFAGVTGEYGQHAIQANVRSDENSQFGAPVSGSIAYGYRITPQAKVRAAFGKAFHAPTFNDLYFPGFSNPALRPEEARNREIGFDYELGDQRLGATYFDNRISDLIVFVFDPVTFEGMPVNLARARIRGLELSYEGRWLGTEVRVLATVQDPKSEDTGFLLQRRARRHGSVAAHREFGGWTVGAELLASGARFDSADESPASRLHGYAVANLTVARRIARDWALELRWNNVGDTRYELVQGYNTPGSNVLLSVKWSAGR